MPKLIYRIIPSRNNIIIKEWYKNEWGHIHREGGPAVIEADILHWYKENKRHRDDGPAVVCTDGTELYYLNGEDADPY